MQELAPVRILSPAFIIDFQSYSETQPEAWSSELTKLTLISRSYCHLCHEMEQALWLLASEFDVDLDVLDVDADPELEARYNELVPVLLHQGNELCHYFLDIPKVRDLLSKSR